MAVEDEKLEHTIGRFVVNLIPPAVAWRETTRVEGTDMRNDSKPTFEKTVGYVDLVASLGMAFFWALNARGVLPAESLNTIFYGYLVERVAVAVLGTVWQGKRD